jgi:tRNA-2-methylthio-N6-dimethylallyladenosine synthase
VAEEVKKRRNNELLAIQNAVSLADHLKQVGTTVEVLVEGPSKNALREASPTGPMQLTGRTPTDHIVVLDGHPRLTGQTVRVRIDEATSFTLFGQVETSEQVFPTAQAEGHRTVQVPVPQRLSLPLV